MKKTGFLLFGNMPKNIPHLGCVAICLLALLTTALPVAAQLPTVPGFKVEIYANLSRPARLTFAPSGVLYVGTQNDPAKIYRIGVGGFPVEEYGDVPLIDPDAVAFDASGAISGTPGSVLVGGGAADEGYIAAILPDQSVVRIFSGPSSGLRNPQYLRFDRVGRLLIADWSLTQLLVTTGATPTPIGECWQAVEVDGANRIFSAVYGGTIRIFAPDGSVLEDSFVSYDTDAIIGLAFGPYDPVWKGDLVGIVWDGTELLRIDAFGNIKVIGTGFKDGFVDLAFGPDGTLYVSVSQDNVIYRIVPTTCEGYCGKQSSAGCWCDYACKKYGDCCPDFDYEEQCVTCEGYCGKQSSAGCWCDDLCQKYGDCCPDYLQVCQ